MSAEDQKIAAQLEGPAAAGALEAADATESETSTEGEGNELDEARMSLLEHLQELRKRLRNAAIVFIVAVFGSFYFVDHAYETLLRPVKLGLLDNGVIPQINQSGVGTGFWVFFKLSMVVGALAASPFILWELWKFIAPGLYKKERKMALVITSATALCFVGGAVFGYFMLARTTCTYLLGFGSAREQKQAWDKKINDWDRTHPPPVGSTTAEADASDYSHLVAKLQAGTLTEEEKSRFATRPVGVSQMLMIDEVLSFMTGLLLGCGAAFELPVVLAFLGWIGLISARGLWKFNKYALVLAAIVGGVLTPSPDAISQLMLAGPLYALYNLSIIVVWMIERGRKRKQAEIDESYEGAGA